MMPAIIGPAEGMLGTLGALRHYLFYVQRDPTGVVATAYREAMPSFVDEVERAEPTRELLRLRSEQRPLGDVVTLLRDRG
jgi:hypothetical protein